MSRIISIEDWPARVGKPLHPTMQEELQIVAKGEEAVIWDTTDAAFYGYKNLGTLESAARTAAQRMGFTVTIAHRLDDNNPEALLLLVRKKAE